MRFIGFLLILFGAFGMLGGMGMETSVWSGLSRIENIGLLSRQSALLTVSAFGIATGCILIGLASVRDAVNRVGTQIAASMERAPAQVPAAAEPAHHTRTAPSTSAADATKRYQSHYDQASAHGSDSSGAEVISVAAPGSRAFNIGDRVHHQSFGLGTVTVLDGENASVKFDSRPAAMPMLMRYLQRA